MKLRLPFVFRLIFIIFSLFFAGSSFATNEPINTSFIIHNLWLLIAAILVFTMHLGFATLEAGLVQSKNCVNILFKNTAIIAIGLLTYALIGFGLMYPGEEFKGMLMGFAGFGLDSGIDGLTPTYNPGYTYWTDFLFPAMFAATTATIVSGAVAERIKLSSFLVFSTLFVTFCYPVVGMWKWGGGFLDQLDISFYDFAGSTIVHTVGGWAALTGAIILGPRLGKFSNGKANTIPASNPVLVAIGAFLLWFGWFGFNGGSVLSADPVALSLVFVTTALAGAMGVLGSGITSWLLQKKPDLLMTLNGALAGLVSITAGADKMSPIESMLIGLLGGILVVFSTKIVEKLEIDDPVGAVSVHLVCGIWGTLAVGLFGQLASLQQLMSQLIGIGSVGIFSFIFSYILFKGIEKSIGLRVNPQEEEIGLDISEHANNIGFYENKLYSPVLEP